MMASLPFTSIGCGAFATGVCRIACVLLNGGSSVEKQSLILLGGGAASAVCGEYLLHLGLLRIVSPVKWPWATALLNTFLPLHPSLLTYPGLWWLGRACNVQASSTLLAFYMGGALSSGMRTLVRVGLRLQRLKSDLSVLPHSITSRQTHLRLLWLRKSLPPSLRRLQVKLWHIDGRCEHGMFAVDVPTTPSDELVLFLSNLRPGSKYRIRVVGTDASGCSGRPSRALTLSTMGTALDDPTLRLTLAAAATAIAREPNRAAAEVLLRRLLERRSCVGLTLRQLLAEHSSLCGPGQECATVGVRTLHSVHEDASQRMLRVTRLWVLMAGGMAQAEARSRLRLVWWGAADPDGPAPVIAIASPSICIICFHDPNSVRPFACVCVERERERARSVYCPPRWGMAREHEYKWFQAKVALAAKAEGGGDPAKIG